MIKLWLGKLAVPEASKGAITFIGEGVPPGFGSLKYNKGGCIDEENGLKSSQTPSPT
jgi:hypothetical protein